MVLGLNLMSFVLLRWFCYSSSFNVVWKKKNYPAFKEHQVIFSEQFTPAPHLRKCDNYTEQIKESNRIDISARGADMKKCVL
jgi:hypothetical protein